MSRDDYLDEKANVGDSLYAVVMGGGKNGIYLILETGEDGFARFARIPAGTEVLCTVLKESNETWRALVSIDTVLQKSA